MQISFDTNENPKVHVSIPWVLKIKIDYMESIIHSVLDATRLALFIRYIYVSNLQLLNIVILKS
jgi:hypothetical protein